MSVRAVSYGDRKLKGIVGKRERRTHTTSSLGSMSLLSRMAFSTAPPSLPVALVSANILIVECVFVSVQIPACRREWLLLPRDAS